MTAHAEASAVVDDDEIRTAFFNELGADARACASRDDGLALLESGVEAIDDFLSRVRVSDSGPGIGHGEESEGYELRVMCETEDPLLGRDG
jgi:hypothetical protein